MEAIKCVSCGSPSIDKVGIDEYLCSCCGTRLKDNSSQKIVVIQQGWICTSCGFNNEPQSTFCGQCGKKLVKYCENCGHGSQLQFSVCPKCGKNNFLGLNNFRMIANDLFQIRGRGVAVVGKIVRGSINVNDCVYIEKNGAVSKYSVLSIEMRHKNEKSAKEGDVVGLLIGANKEDINRGDELVN